MDFLLRAFNIDNLASENIVADQGIQRCPFLRNINEPTNFSFSPAPIPPPAARRANKGPIFEDGPNFDMAFRMFHGEDGIVPLSNRSSVPHDSPNSKPAPPFNPLAARAATISLSTLGLGGPFGFNFFSEKMKKHNQNIFKNKDLSGQNAGDSSHEALSNEWLETGQCPVAKSYRAVSHVLPLVAKALQPPPGVKLRCPPAIVAARAALARTALVKNLRPQPLPAKMMAITLLGMAVNIPLGIWREHTMKFSLQWFAAVHAAVPFIAMLRKCVLMPKAAMAITIAASIVGQTIGSRAERYRMMALAAARESSSATCQTVVMEASKVGSCGEEAGRPWNPPVPNVVAVADTVAAAASASNVCF